MSVSIDWARKNKILKNNKYVIEIYGMMLKKTKDQKYTNVMLKKLTRQEVYMSYSTSHLSKTTYKQHSTVQGGQEVGGWIPCRWERILETTGGRRGATGQGNKYPKVMPCAGT